MEKTEKTLKPANDFKRATDAFKTETGVVFRELAIRAGVEPMSITNGRRGMGIKPVDIEKLCRADRRLLPYLETTKKDKDLVPDASELEKKVDSLAQKMDIMLAVMPGLTAAQNELRDEIQAEVRQMMLATLKRMPA